MGRLRRRAARGAGPGLILALLTAVMAAFAVAIPAVQARAYDSSVEDVLGAAPRAQREFMIGMGPYLGVDPVGDVSRQPYAEAVNPRAEGLAHLRQAIGEEGTAALGAPDFSAQTAEQRVLGEIEGTAEAVVRAQSGFDERVTYEVGGPRAASELVTLTDGEGDLAFVRRVHVIPVVLLSSAAREHGLSVGQRLDLEPAPQSARTGRFVIEISGLYTPKDGTDPFWDAQPRMRAAETTLSPQGGTIWQVAFVVAADQVGPLAHAMSPVPVFREADQTYAPNLAYQWRFRPRLDLTRSGAAALVDALDRASRYTEWSYLRPRLNTGLPTLVQRHAAAVRVTGSISALVISGVLVLGLLVAALIARLLALRRSRTIHLLRARGASVPAALTGPVLEVLAWTLPAAGLAALAVTRWPGDHPWSTVAGLALVVLVPVLSAVIGALHGSASARGRDGTAAEPAPSRMAGVRVVCELGVLLLAGLAISSMRARGAEIAAGEQDWIASVSPALLAAAAAIIAARLLPVLMSPISAATRRSTSVLGFVGTTRTRRGGSATGAVLAVTIAAALVTMLGSVITTIGHERERVSYAGVGADLRLDAHRVDAAEADAIAARPGVTAALPANAEARGQVSTPAGSDPAQLLAIDLRAYAERLAGTPLAFTPPAEAIAGAQSGAIPVLLSAGFAPVGAEITVRMDGASVPARVAGIDPRLRRESGEDLVVAMDLARTVAVKPSLQTNAVFVFGSADATAHLAEANPLTLATGSPADRRAAYAAIDTGHLPDLVTRTVIIAASLAGVLSALALGLTLLLTRPERAFLLQRLRVLGLPRRRNWVLAAAEVLPASALAAAVGVATGLGLLRLTRSALDLAPFTGGRVGPALEPNWAIAVAVLAALPLLAFLAILIDAALARRSDLATHLRAGGI